MQKYIISVSKKNKSIWKIYFYDEDFKIQSKRINPLLVWFYKLKERHRNYYHCNDCNNNLLALTNWYDNKINCPYCDD